ncbi:hypothetical protein BSKO_03659 [Bryopsis sp. KO-2023]|nr:hypothetical protein BSKO_03659 [Bryopsis sp. KO-2023]
MATGFEAHGETPDDVLENLLATLAQRKEAWFHTSTEDRASLLHDCRRCAIQVSRRAAQAAVQAHGSYGSGCGEEWLGWLPVVMGLRELEDAVRCGGKPRPVSIRKQDRGAHEQYVADVFPRGMDALLFPNVRGEVWLQKDKLPTQGAVYREKDPAGLGKGVKAKVPGLTRGKVALVLGSGNQLSAIILDILHKLFVDDEVVLLKLNPVNEFLGQYVAAALKPLMLRGFIGFCYGGMERGLSLCRHRLIDTIRVTGSEDTYNAIVRGRPNSNTGGGGTPLEKPVMVELGNVSPVIVVPGRWSSKDLDCHADIVASALVHNSGHTSTGVEVLVLDESWPLRVEFMDRLRRRLKMIPQRVGWYPKSKQKQHGFRRTFPDVEELGIHHSGSKVSTLPFLLVTGQSPEESSTRMETWTTAVQEVLLPTNESDPASFLRSAVQFANESCWGTQSCTLLIHPWTQKMLGSDFQDAIAGLKYGNIVVNAPAIMGYSITAATWGGYPGSLPRSVDMAKVACTHNTLMFDHPEKSVVYYPFHQSFPLLFSPTFTNTEEVVDKALEFIDSPSLTKAVGFYGALRKG